MTSLHQATTATVALEQSLIDVYDFTPEQAAALAATVDPADIEPGSVAGIAQRLAEAVPAPTMKLYVVVTGRGYRFHYAPSDNGNPGMTLCGREVYRPYGCVEAVPGFEEASCKICLRQLPIYQMRMAAQS